MFIVGCGEPTTPALPNQAPEAPSNPFPEDNAVQTNSVTLTWTSTDPDGDDIRYDVYFGLTSDPEAVSENQADSAYTPPELLIPGVSYFWKIIARDDKGNSTTGPIWQFSTGPPFWEVMLTPSAARLNAIWGANHGNIFAAGNNVMLQFDGTNWSDSEFKPGVNLLDVTGGFMKTYAVGGNSIYQKIGLEDWVETRILPSWLTPTSIAIGHDGIFHVAFFGVHSTFEVAFLVYSSTDGGVNLTQFGGSEQNRSVSIWTDSRNGPVTGVGNSIGNESVIQTFKIGEPAEEIIGSSLAPLLAIWKVANTMYAVGEQGKILKNDGAGWLFEQSNTTNSLHDVWARATDDVYVVGENRTILHYNGVVWKTFNLSQVVENPDVVFRGVWGIGDSVFVVGDDGIILKH
jgi:hypothetical protein